MMPASSPENFDPYYKWLGIPPENQPANHYQLLGLQALEGDPEVIAVAADRQMLHIKSFAAGKYSEQSQQILNELTQAKLCLLNPHRKQAYDAQLKASVEKASMPAISTTLTDEALDEDTTVVVVTPGPHCGESNRPRSRRIRKAILWCLLSACLLVASVAIAAIFAPLRIVLEASEAIEGRPSNPHFTVRCKPPPKEDLTVWLHFSGEAKLGVDYDLMGYSPSDDGKLRVTIPRGTSHATIKLIPTDDGIVREDKNILCRIDDVESEARVHVSNSSGALKIIDRERAQLSVVYEPDVGNFVFSLTKRCMQEVRFDYRMERYDLDGAKLSGNTGNRTIRPLELRSEEPTTGFRRATIKIIATEHPKVDISKTLSSAEMELPVESSRSGPSFNDSAQRPLEAAFPEPILALAPGDERIVSKWIDYLKVADSQYEAVHGWAEEDLRTKEALVRLAETRSKLTRALQQVENGRNRAALNELGAKGFECAFVSGLLRAIVPDRQVHSLSNAKSYFEICTSTTPFLDPRVRYANLRATYNNLGILSVLDNQAYEALKDWQLCVAQGPPTYDLCQNVHRFINWANESRRVSMKGKKKIEERRIKELDSVIKGTEKLLREISTRAHTETVPELSRWNFMPYFPEPTGNEELDSIVGELSEFDSGKGFAIGPEILVTHRLLTDDAEKILVIAGGGTGIDLEPTNLSAKGGSDIVILHVPELRARSLGLEPEFSHQDTPWLPTPMQGSPEASDPKRVVGIIEPVEIDCEQRMLLNTNARLLPGSPVFAAESGKVIGIVYRSEAWRAEFMAAVPSPLILRDVIEYSHDSQRQASDELLQSWETANDPNLPYEFQIVVYRRAIKAAWKGRTSDTGGFKIPDDWNGFAYPDP